METSAHLKYRSLNAPKPTALWSAFPHCQNRLKPLPTVGKERENRASIKKSAKRNRTCPSSIIYEK
jgi:hypothetical protein